MRRVAAIDCGTNSIRLLIADVDPTAARLIDVERRLEIVRLGQGVDATGVIAPQALARTLDVLEQYVKLIERHRAGAVRMVATSATRDARNRADFIAGVTRRLGVPPEIVTGEEEARLSYTGATRELAGSGLATPYLVVDIGGGSTELVLGDRQMRAAVSVDIGCVRLTERHLHDDPPTAGQVAAARRDAGAALARAASVVPLTPAATLIGLAGTVTTLAAIVLGLPTYDPARIHRSRIAATDIHAVTRRMLTASRAERAALPVMHPGRVDVIGGGALILDEIMTAGGFGEVVVSEHDILDGIAWELADPR